MKLLSLFLIAMILSLALFDRASAQRGGGGGGPAGPTPHPHPNHHSHKHHAYHHHIFRKRELVDFPEYQDSNI
jgi:hypothetical protein